MNIFQNLTTISNFAIYFGSSIALFLAFSYIYLLLTPYDELKLISKGVTAASITFLGAAIGFVLPLASVVSHSVSISDMLVWSLLAMLIQIGSFLFIRFLIIRDLAEKIENNSVATSIFVSTITVCIGLINSACMSY